MSAHDFCDSLYSGRLPSSVRYFIDSNESGAESSRQTMHMDDLAQETTKFTVLTYV